MRRSKFSLSHYRLMSCNGGLLVPCGLTEVLPGDTVQQGTAILLRVSPLLAPVMHPLHVRVHHWYVPHRLVWEDFENFITGGPDGMDDSEFPTITYDAGLSLGSLGDYFGLPVGVNNMEVSALPFRGYNLIFNEWYRDQDLQDVVAWSKESGADDETVTSLLRCSWEKDYFTSARPWEQKGPSISLPLGGNAPVIGEGDLVGLTSGITVSTQGGSGASFSNKKLRSNWSAASGPMDVRVDESGATSSRDLQYTGGIQSLPGSFEADLSGVSAVNVNQLREAMALQRFEEARARYGSRYTEYLRYLGVRSSDARLQRPEYLGGGKATVQFSEVLQTAEGNSPVGEMRGHGIGAMRTRRYRRFIEEHGYIISLLSVRPKTMYLQGIARTWNRRIKEDFWQRELQHIGQQEVLNKELYAAAAQPDGTFGWQDRYDEYRRVESGVSGEFRDTLDFWHMARDFASEPALNADFVQCMPTDRNFAVESSGDHYYCMVRHNIQARRMVSQSGKSFIF